MHKYRLISKKGEGTFSEVLKAQCIKTGQYVAIKCMKNTFESIDQVNNLREIQALRRLSPHPNIITLLEVLYDQPSGRLALVFELMDMNIYELIRERRHYLAGNRVRSFMYQLCRAMDHMHRNGIFHRDIKPENILIKDEMLKLADFGSCRGIYSKQPFTEYISTRWYRAPECLLTDGYYSYKMDIWGLGCVFFEIMSLYPLFPGTNELDQVAKIHQIMGTPGPELLAHFQKKSSHMDFNFPAQDGTGLEKMLNHVVPECIDLLYKLLAYKPDDRVSARQALRHPHFRELRDAEKRNQKVARQAAPAAPASPAPSNASAMTARSTESKVKEAKDLHNNPKSMNMKDNMPELQKTHKSISNTTSSVGGKTPNGKPGQDDDSNAMLPPIHKTNLQIDVNQGTAPKKNNMLHKAAAKPAAALMNQKGGSHKGMTNRRNKKEDPMQGLSVYNSKGGQGGAR
jgi:serine/threonine protein kinase